jgi:hypothetical protein
MKSNAKSSPEFKNFENVATRVLSVSKAEIQRRLEAEKLANKDKPKRGPKPKIEKAAE